MTVVTGIANIAATNIFESDVLQAITTGVLDSHSSSTQFLFSNAYFIIVAQGSGFGYSHGHPSSGTMTSMEFQLGEDASEWSGFSVSVASAWSAASQGDVAGFTNLFFGGNDTFNMQENTINDQLTGGNGNDTFNYGYNIAYASFLDGGSGTDTLNIDGGAPNDFDPTRVMSLQISNIEIVNLTGGHSYNIAYSPSSTVTVNGSALLAGDVLTFDGSGTGNGSLIITAGAGNDTFVSGLGNDTFNGGAGSDTVDYSHATSGVTVNLNLTTAQAVGGGLGTNILTSVENIVGSNYNDTLIGNAADNFFTISNGVDYVDGGLGNDTVSFAHAKDAITLDLRPDAAPGGDTFKAIETFIGSPFNDTFIGDANNNVFYSGGNEFTSLDAANPVDTVDYEYATGPMSFKETGDSNEQVTFVATGGGQGTDTLVGFSEIIGSSYDDTFYLLAPSVRIVAGDGFDTISFQYASGSIEFRLQEEDQYAGSIENLIGSSHDDNLFGSDGGDSISGGAGNDSIDGGDGNDTIHGGDGNDAIVGNAGSDTIYGDGGDDTLSGGDYGLEFDGNDVIYGGDGNDTIYASASSGINKGNCTLDGGPGNDQLWGGDGNNTADYSDATSGVTVSLAITTAQAVGGGLGTDTLHYIQNLTGSNFDDTLSGDGGNNVLNGGNGTDTVSYDNATAGVNVSLSIAGAQAIGGGQGSDTLISIENLTGSYFGDTLHGSSADNIVSGLSGDDTIDLSAGGNDTALGGFGNDIFILGAALTAADQIDGGTGYDTVRLNGDYSTGVVFTATTMVNVEQIIPVAGHSYNLTLSDATVAAGQTLTVDGSGLGSSDSLTLDGSQETDGNFILRGGAGNDVLKGGAGNDTFTGGAGNDTLNGGGGSDTVNYAGATSGVTIDLSLATAQAVGGGQGSDTFISIENIIGSNFNDTLSGNSSDNMLNGGTGIDTVSYANATGGVNVSLSVSTAQAVGGGQGNDTLVSIENLAGSNFNDVLRGSAANNVISGLGGNDTIDLTAGGTDVAQGGDGNDVILMGGALTSADQIDGGVGTDTVILNGDYSLGVVFGTQTMVNVEAINLVAGHSYKLTTNEATVASGQTLTVNGGTLGAGDMLNFDGSHEHDGSFIIVGGAGNDVLTGGAGNDRLTGGLGADHLTGGPGADTFVYANAAQSTGANYDTLTFFDFAADKFDLKAKVLAIDTAITAGALTTASFDSDLAASVNKTLLGKHHAVIFTPDSGDLAGKTFLVIDINGVAGYQAGKDIVIQLDHAAHLSSLDVTDFV